MGEGKTKEDSCSRVDLKSVTESQKQPPPPPPPQKHPFAPPYQGYPPPYPGNPDLNYQYPPPPGYYPITARNFVLLGPPKRSHGYKFGRVFLTVMIIIFFGMAVLSLLTWIINGSDVPVFHAKTLDMRVFSLNNMSINATWNANVSVRNPSHRYDVQYNYVEASLVYEDHVVDTNFVNPFLLKNTERQSIFFVFRTPNARQNKNNAGGAWVKDLENERRERGSVVFDVRIIANAVYKRDGHHTGRTLRIFCGELEVVFPSPVVDTPGTLNDKYKECIILS